ncbi:hypothetical protein BDA96_06G071400 [Sorghum bicolor]|uniref:Uncharacterized protein n=1 Tax=Sorghum bicolor TaxID=4558 RepID=A0A921QP22_SORBI|nr:hypothetical protein BDA96_06G071400 [Sorghum bicolor]
MVRVGPGGQWRGVERNPGPRPILPAGSATATHCIKATSARRAAAVCRSAAPQQPVSPVWDRKVSREPGGADGVQLRRHRGGGEQVPRPRPRPPPPPPPPQQQHDADRRGGVAQDDAEELVVRLVRPQPRLHAQVRVCAGHSRRLLQVPPPPQQLPQPPGVPSVPGHHLRRAAAGRGRVLLPYRRGAVTARRPSVSTKKRRPTTAVRRRGEERNGKKGKTYSPSVM